MTCLLPYSFVVCKYDEACLHSYIVKQKLRCDMPYIIYFLHYWLLPSLLNCSKYTKQNDNGDKKQITSPAGHTVLFTNKHNWDW